MNQDKMHEINTLSLKLLNTFTFIRRKVQKESVI